MKAIELFVTEYLRHLKGRGQSWYTRKNAKSALKRFEKYLTDTGTEKVENIDHQLLEDFQQSLCFNTDKNGNLLSIRTQALILGIVKGFTGYLKKRNCFVVDPGKDIQLPKKPKTLPKVILTSEEVKRILSTAEMTTNRGYRDRIVLELLYDTAIRRSEICSIQIKHLDLEDGYVHIRGKGNKQRVVPVSARVCELVGNYLKMIRPQLVKGKDSGHLILNRFGKSMGPNGVWSIVKRYAKQSGVQKNVSTHTFRHTCATHMMKNGAPVRHIQELLGHESLESTQIYTRVTINDLKKVHSKYHPGDDIGGRR